MPVSLVVKVLKVLKVRKAVESSKFMCSVATTPPVLVSQYLAHHPWCEASDSMITAGHNGTSTVCVSRVDHQVKSLIISLIRVI